MTQIHAEPRCPFVIPTYIGGPLDGGCDAEIHKAAELHRNLPLRQGYYVLSGYKHARDVHGNVFVAQMSPDYAVYRWEAR